MRTVATLVMVFAAAAAIAGVTDSAITVYWLAAFDPEFRDAPFVAFEVALWGTLVITLIGAIVAAVAAYLLRRRLSVSPKSVVGCCLLGAAYPLLAPLLPEWLGSMVSPEGLIAPLVGWLYLVLFPAFALRLIAAPGAGGNAHAA
jgi:hypothetical protein